MAAAYELEQLPGGGFVLPRLSARVGPDTLHHGPILVGLEQSALQAAAASVGTDRLLLRSISMRIARAGRRGPFTCRADVVASAGPVVGCRAEMTDGDGNIIAVALSSYHCAS